MSHFISVSFLSDPSLFEQELADHVLHGKESWTTAESLSEHIGFSPSHQWYHKDSAKISRDESGKLLARTVRVTEHYHAEEFEDWYFPVDITTRTFHHDRCARLFLTELAKNLVGALSKGLEESRFDCGPYVRYAGMTKITTIFNGNVRITKVSGDIDEYTKDYWDSKFTKNFFDWAVYPHIEAFFAEKSITVHRVGTYELQFNWDPSKLTDIPPTAFEVQPPSDTSVKNKRRKYIKID